jgi:hypothetical protein
LSKTPFLLRIRIGEAEVELGGDREEIMRTLDDLGAIVGKVSRAFGAPAPSRELSGGDAIQISLDECGAEEALDEAPPVSESRKAEAPTYPQVPRTSKCSEAVSALLNSEWGRTPRSISELRGALEANAVFFPKTTLSGVLVWLVKRRSIRRWKDAKRGYLYTVNAPEGA